MDKLIIFWHRRDLRIKDNLGLHNAYKETPKVISLFCLDPAILERDDIAPARVKYLLGSLEELKENYHKQGSDLLVFHSTPQKIIPELAKTLKAEAVYWNNDIEPFARDRDQEITEKLEAENIKVKTFWDQLLHAPGEILTKSQEKPYNVYTPFWRNWAEQPKDDPVPIPDKLVGLDQEQTAIAEDLGAGSIPTLKELGYSWDNELLLSAGEKAAQEQLEYFCHDKLVYYNEQRNYPALDSTSKLSAAIKFGTISVRTIWQKTIEQLDNCSSDEARDNIITWQKELAWREFYQHCLYFYPELTDGPYREHFKHFPWQNDEELFTAWCEGKTGYPIVDAAMRQLNEIGWMHNRCRMIVASFLTKDLIIDWRWGEKYFMQKLYDGDLASNNGGWQWSASSGMDPKPLRIFNPASQAQKYDQDAEYIRQWLPEIRHLDTEELVTGKIPPENIEDCDYPSPIVDHKKRQREFKNIYQSVKD